MFRYALTIFLSAFLLFQVQPLVARLMLPRYGGTSVVWGTCLMYFQMVLLLGYLYVHTLRRFVSPRASWVIHLGVLMTAAFALGFDRMPVIGPGPQASVAVSIAAALTRVIGLPFFALSTTGPLVQAWHSTSHPSQNPYRLFALSNLGSMLALVSYPFLVEPNWGLSRQERFWTVGFLLFTLFSCWSGWQVRARRKWHDGAGLEEGAGLALGPLGRGNSQVDTFEGRKGWFWWLALSATGSCLLLSTTHLMTLEVASFPFLWILPLALYLGTLILCFEKPRWYRSGWVLPAYFGSVVVGVLLVHLGTQAPLVAVVGGMAAVCFFGCLACHGELQRIKPRPNRLTAFYLWMSIGGALGGVLVVLVAPRVFDGYYEFHLSVLAAIGFPLALILGRARQTDGLSVGHWLTATGGLVVASMVACSLLYSIDPSFQPNRVFRARNEYGVVSVVDSGAFRLLVNGQTIHGGQSLNQSFADLPNLYYIDGSGAAIAFRAMHARRTNGDVAEPLDVGVLGLGAGTLAAWGQPGDRFQFFELNPLVVDVAQRYFNYIRPAALGSSVNHRGVQIDVKIGDGRILLNRRGEDAEHRPFDLLFIDAFSSDSIPIHLMTREALELYLQHVKPDGLVIFHITNRFVDLRPVMQGLYPSLGAQATLIEHANPVLNNTTRWVIVSRDPSWHGPGPIGQTGIPWPTDRPPIDWTDDHASLAPVLIWSDAQLWHRLLDRPHSFPDDPGTMDGER